MRKHHITSLAAGWNWKQINEGGVYLPSLGRFFSRVTLSGFSSGSCRCGGGEGERSSRSRLLLLFMDSSCRGSSLLRSWSLAKFSLLIPEPVLACTAYRDYVLCPASGRYGTVCPDSALGPGCVRCDSVGLDCSCGPACDHFGSDGPDWGRDLCCGHFGSGGQGWARGPAFGRGCRLVCTVCRGSRRAPCSSRGCDHIRDHVALRTRVTVRVAAPVVVIVVVTAEDAVIWGRATFDHTDGDFSWSLYCLMKNGEKKNCSLIEFWFQLPVIYQRWQ